MSIPRAGLTPRAKVLLPVFLLVLVLATYFRVIRQPDSAERVFDGETMGTTFHIVLSGADLDDQTVEAARSAVAVALARVDSLMSTFRDDSELMQFNASSSTEPFSVSKETAEVVNGALLLWKQSGGAFDATVRPLVAAWGFGAGAKLKPPSDAELADLRARVGSDGLRVTLEPPTLQKTRPELSIDLSAIAKGYAVDVVSELLARMNLPNHMVELGGEIRVAGKKADGARWNIGIEQPDSETRLSRLVLALTDTSLATSGDYRNYTEREGQRVSHTIDPRTGRPVEHSLASVSVLSPTCMMADGYATALNVLGPQAGLELAERLNLAAFFIVRTPQGDFETRASSRFAALQADR